MRRTKLNVDKFHWANLPELVAVAILVAVWFAPRCQAQQPGQKTFSSSEEASSALIAAMQSKDEKALLALLGPHARSG